MLFARFLAENHLLIEPDTGVAVTLDECEELAQEVGLDRWALAARFAHRMLPQVFRPDHLAFELQLAREHRLQLERLVEELPPELFGASDALGWVYQFWQSRRKDEVNSSEVKIGAEQLPAVTQLFTEPYMVQFLLDNSLGAWWAARRLTAPEVNCAATEADLRQAASIPRVALDYLRFVRDDAPEQTTVWRPAAGSFDAWPQHLWELRVIDPCCGSGHFLVAAFSMLIPMRMESEGLSARDAVDAVLRNNLYGLELDPRCLELAAFALALASWRYPDAGGYRPLPEFNLACSGLAVGATRERWAELGAGNHNLRIALEWMHEAFRDAPVLGSLVNPTASDAATLSDWRDLSVALGKALAEEPVAERREATIAAQGLAKAAELLAGSYHLVVTNVPYLARGKQDQTLRDFCDRYHPVAKNDLATVFLERCRALCTEGGSASLVLPQNWLFLKSYQKLREKLLKTEMWHLLARLGPGAFETISGEVVKAVLLTLSRGNPAAQPAGLFGPPTAPGTMYGFDVSDSRTAPAKAARLPTADLTGVPQSRQLENPDSCILTNAISFYGYLSAHAASYHGISTTDYAMFGRKFWELGRLYDGWIFQQSTVRSTTPFGGKEAVLWYEEGRGRLRDLYASKAPVVITGLEAWSRPGVAVSQMRDLPSTRYLGNAFDDNTGVLIPNDPSDLAAMWAFCASPHYSRLLRTIDQSVKVTYPTLVKVPFDRDYWTDVARHQYPSGLPNPYSDDPTQWIFHGHPCASVVWDETDKRTAHGPLRADRSVLQVAVARLLGYRWPAEQNTETELADEQGEWVRRCAALSAYADEDGIVCIPPVRGEPSAAERLLRLLVAAYGDEWHDDHLIKILADAGAVALDDWLRDRFFDQHCTLFHQRPFVWHVWDGRRPDGFHALVNYHKLAEGDSKGRQLLESLTYSYLGDWITRQQDGAQRGEAGAEDRLTAALELRSRLEAILQGEPPFDIFVRWKPMHQQPIGWEPDINDGVRLNIRPFMAHDLPGGKKGAGILRTKPNLHWRKDRGKEPLRDASEFPWFWNGGQFTADRVNDVHLSNAAKRTN